MITYKYKGKTNLNQPKNNGNYSKSNPKNNKLTPREVIQLVKDSIGIEEGLDRYFGISLTHAKGNRTKLIPCPFHGEKTPSFAVTPSENKFHCFGCQVKGDVITLVSLLQGVSQARAAYVIADDFGLIARDNKGNKSFQNAEIVRLKVMGVEQQRELKRKEKETFSLLIDIDKNLITPFLNKPNSVEEMERISKIYHLKSEIAYFLDLLTYTDETDHGAREENFERVQKWIGKKILPLLDVFQGVRK